MSCPIALNMTVIDKFCWTLLPIYVTELMFWTGPLGCLVLFLAMFTESFECSANYHRHLMLWNGCSHSRLVFETNTSEERGKYHCDKSVLPVTKKERGWKRQKRISPRMKDGHSSKNATAYKVTSQRHDFAAAFSNEKAESYYRVGK